MFWLTPDKHAWLGGNWGCWVQWMLPDWCIFVLAHFPAVRLFLYLQMSYWQLKIRPELACKNTTRTGTLPITVPLQSSSAEVVEWKHLISRAFFLCLFVSISSLMEQIDPYPLEQGEGGVEGVFELSCGTDSQPGKQSRHVYEQWVKSHQYLICSSSRNNLLWFIFSNDADFEKKHIILNRE